MNHSTEKKKNHEMSCVCVSGPHVSVNIQIAARPQSLFFMLFYRYFFLIPSLSSTLTEQSDLLRLGVLGRNGMFSYLYCVCVFSFLFWLKVRFSFCYFVKSIAGGRAGAMSIFPYVGGLHSFQSDQLLQR